MTAPSSVRCCLCLVALATLAQPLATAAAAAARPTAAAAARSADVSQLLGAMVARATSTSQVLTLNITNLVILLVVKAIIIAGGFLVFGGSGLNLFSSDAASGRSSGESSWLDRDDMLLMLTYLQGDSQGDYMCMLRVACERPQLSLDYVKAGKLLMTAAKFAEGLVSVDRKYYRLLRALETAVHMGSSSAVCAARYPCTAS